MDQKAVSISAHILASLHKKPVFQYISDLRHLLTSLIAAQKNWFPYQSTNEKNVHRYGDN